MSVILVLVVAAFVAAPLLGRRTSSHTAPDVELYKAQLSEVDNDLARGLIAEADAETAKTEIARRLLAANKIAQNSGSAQDKGSRTAALVSGAALLVITIGSYVLIGSPGEPDQPLAERLELAEQMRLNRPSQAEFEAVAPLPPEVDAPEEYLQNVNQLRQIMPTRPDDLRGWELLAFHETELRNYPAAARAQAQILRLTDGGTLEDKVRYIDLLVAAADGQVSPEAEEVVRRILAEDETNVAARYYLGSLHNLTARPDIAFRVWRPLVEEAPDSFHVALARAQIEGAAFRAGIDYTAPEVRGPSAEDIAAAQDMSEEDRMSMIGSMVTGLANRLATEGGPATDWARLITAYGVLGETQTAAEIWTEARTVFSTDPQAIEVLREAAISAGVAE